jgi:hypothetical protein
MAQSKPIGMDKQKYKEWQEIKAEDDFKSSVVQKLQNLHFAINDLNENLLKTDAKNGSAVKDCEIEIHHVMDSCISSLKEFRELVTGCERLCNESKNWMRTLNIAIEDCPTRSDFNDKISHLHDSITRLHNEKDSMRKEFNGLIDRLKLDFDSKLKKQKEEILAIPSEVPNIRKIMDTKLELVELNGQNAALRSSNNERQIMLVERKIENLYQLIKKLDISNQESM